MTDSKASQRSSQTVKDPVVEHSTTSSSVEKNEVEELAPVVNASSTTSSGDADEKGKKKKKGKKEKEPSVSILQLDLQRLAK